jgi:hypothetical protein
MSDPIWYGIDLARNDTASGIVMLMRAGLERTARIEAPFLAARRDLSRRIAAQLYRWLQLQALPSVPPPRRYHPPHGSLRQRKRIAQKRKR